MNIELRNVVIYDKMSEETTAFRASLYIDNKRIGFAKNDGQGGCTTYHPDDHRNWDLLRKAETYCLGMGPDVVSYDGESVTINMTLEYYIEKLLWKFVADKEDAKLKKKMLTKLMWGKREHYLETFWKGWDIEKLMKATEGRDVIKKAIARFREEMPDGKLLNTNIKQELL